MPPATGIPFAAFRAALWKHPATSTGGTASTGFLIFTDTAVGVAALLTARLRRLGSAYARSATRVLSWALLAIPFLGTLTSLYWILAVRKREETAHVQRALRMTISCGLAAAGSIFQRARAPHHKGNR